MWIRNIEVDPLMFKSLLKADYTGEPIATFMDILKKDYGLLFGSIDSFCDECITVTDDPMHTYEYDMLYQQWYAYFKTLDLPYPYNPHSMRALTQVTHDIFEILVKDKLPCVSTASIKSRLCLLDSPLPHQTGSVVVYTHIKVKEVVNYYG